MASTTTVFETKPRLFVLSDITNEPDDTQSLCRYLTYSNQFDTEGIVATTSTWLRDRVAPEAMHAVVDGFEKVVDNLNIHVHPDAQYPTSEHVRSLIKSGAPVSVNHFHILQPTLRHRRYMAWKLSETIYL